jgi:hypothetical protein
VARPWIHFLAVGLGSACLIFNKLSKRNANASDILAKLQLGQKHLAGFDISNQFHHVFWYVVTLWRCAPSSARREAIAFHGHVLVAGLAT